MSLQSQLYDSLGIDFLTAKRALNMTKMNVTPEEEKNEVAFGGQFSRADAEKAWKMLTVSKYDEESIINPGNDNTSLLLLIFSLVTENGSFYNKIPKKEQFGFSDNYAEELLRTDSKMRDMLDLCLYAAIFTGNEKLVR